MKSVRPAVKRRFDVLVAAAVWSFCALVLVPHAAQAADEAVLCLVIDSQPPVLSAVDTEDFRKGLCADPSAKTLSENKEREIGAIILFSIGSGNPDLLVKLADAQGVSKILYSLHSQNEGLNTHSVHLYDVATKTTYSGGRTFDYRGKASNAGRDWAQKAAAAAGLSLEIQNLASRISSEGGMLGAQAAAILGQPEQPSQFLKARRVYPDEDKERLKKWAEGLEPSVPAAAKSLAESALFFLTGDDEQALRAFDSYAAGAPEPSVAIVRTNLLLAMHRYEEALKTAEDEERVLGFEFFLFSKSIAAGALGRSEESVRLINAFRQRAGSDWERLTLPVVQAASRTGDAQTLKAYAEPFLAASPTPSAKESVEKLLKVE